MKTVLAGILEMVVLAVLAAVSTMKAELPTMKAVVLTMKFAVLIMKAAMNSVVTNSVHLDSLEIVIIVALPAIVKVAIFVMANVNLIGNLDLIKLVLKRLTNVMVLVLIIGAPLNRKLMTSTKPITQMQMLPLRIRKNLEMISQRNQHPLSLKRKK